jgi:uncharacterized protein YeeX (DUF496 family)
VKSDYPQAYEKGTQILDAMTPLCKRHDKPFRRLSKAEQGWLLDTLMTYIRLDIKSSEIIECDTLLLHDAEMKIADLEFQNDRLTEQIKEMRHYD